MSGNFLGRCFIRLAQIKNRMLLHRIRIAADIPRPLPACRSHQIPLANLLMTESEVERILALDPAPADLLGDPCVWGRFRAGRVRQAPSPHLPRTNITCVRPSAPPMAQAARRKTGHQGKHLRHRRSSWPGKRGQPPEWPQRQDEPLFRPALLTHPWRGMFD